MIFVNKTFEGHYPTGTSAVVCAPSPEEAAMILQKALKEHGLSQIVLAKNMVKFTLVPGNCMIINDWNY